MELAARGGGEVTMPEGIRKNTYTWHFGSCFSGHDGLGLAVGLGSLEVFSSLASVTPWRAKEYLVPLLSHTLVDLLYQHIRCPFLVYPRWLDFSSGFKFGGIFIGS